jgi:hypothetical protein
MAFWDRRKEGRRTKPVSYNDLPVEAALSDPDLPKTKAFPYKHSETSVRGYLERYGMMGVGPYPLGPKPRPWQAESLRRLFPEDR